MKKRVIAVILSSLLVFALVGCGSNDKESANKDNLQSTEVESTNEVNKSRLDKFKEELKAKGYEVGDNEIVAYEMVGATNGYKFKVDGEPIEIYEYDESKLTDDGKQKLEEAKKGSINMSGINMPVKYNNNLVLIRSDEHSKGNEILEIFNSL